MRNLTAATDPAGRTTRYRYYADGILKPLTDLNGNVTTFERHIEGRSTAHVHADGSRETYAYEPATSRLKSRADPLGRRADYAYARDDRVSAVDYVGAQEPIAPLRFAYDASCPRLTQMTDDQGTTTPTSQSAARARRARQGRGVRVRHPRPPDAPSKPARRLPLRVLWRHRSADGRKHWHHDSGRLNLSVQHR